MEAEISEEYGWQLKLYHRQNLFGLIHSENPDLADRYLDVNLRYDTDYLAELEEIRDQRLDIIQNWQNAANVLPDGAAVAVHVIPNGITSTQPIRPLSSRLVVMRHLKPSSFRCVGSIVRGY